MTAIDYNNDALIAVVDCTHPGSEEFLTKMLGGVGVETLKANGGMDSCFLVATCMPSAKLPAEQREAHRGYRFSHTFMVSNDEAQMLLGMISTLKYVVATMGGGGIVLITHLPQAVRERALKLWDARPILDVSPADADQFKGLPVVNAGPPHNTIN